MPINIIISENIRASKPLDQATLINTTASKYGIFGGMQMVFSRTSYDFSESCSFKSGYFIRFKSGNFRREGKHRLSHKQGGSCLRLPLKLRCGRVRYMFLHVPQAFTLPQFRPHTLRSNATQERGIITCFICFVCFGDLPPGNI